MAQQVTIVASGGAGNGEADRAGRVLALIEDLRVHAPQVRVVLVMPGHVGTDIIANNLRARGLPEPRGGVPDLDGSGAGPGTAGMSLPSGQVTTPGRFCEVGSWVLG